MIFRLRRIHYYQRVQVAYSDLISFSSVQCNFHTHIRKGGGNYYTLDLSKNREKSSMHVYRTVKDTFTMMPYIRTKCYT